MTNFIPIFPLGIVVYPGEDLNLHIFEPRYKQLISECHALKKPFGIPAVIENKVQEYGSVIEITELSEVHDNGEMPARLSHSGGDIKTKGVKVFRILEIVQDVPDKLYGGAIVSYPDNYEKGNPELMAKLMNQIRELHRLLKINKEFKKEDLEMTCYDVAHHIGLSLEEEYELLILFDERQRQEYLKRHLTKVISMLTGMEQLTLQQVQGKIKGNGHFKNLGGVDFGK
jgi:Lon protease-like protein